MCPFLTMNLTQNTTRLICSPQVSFVATPFKILIREDAKNTVFPADTGKQGHWVELDKFLAVNIRNNSFPTPEVTEL